MAHLARSGMAEHYPVAFAAATKEELDGMVAAFNARLTPA
jgi:hypothetical protein